MQKKWKLTIMTYEQPFVYFLLHPAPFYGFFQFSHVIAFTQKAPKYP